MSADNPPSQPVSPHCLAPTGGGPALPIGLWCPSTAPRVHPARRLWASAVEQRATRQRCLRREDGGGYTRTACTAQTTILTAKSRSDRRLLCMEGPQPADRGPLQVATTIRRCRVGQHAVLPPCRWCLQTASASSSRRRPDVDRIHRVCRHPGRYCEDSAKRPAILPWMCLHATPPRLWEFCLLTCLPGLGSCAWTWNSSMACLATARYATHPWYIVSLVRALAVCVTS
jgi:hypothetical protein